MYIKIPNFQNLKSIKVLPPLGQKPDFQKNKKLIIQEIFAQLIWNFASQLKIGPLIIPENFKSIRAAVPEIAPTRAHTRAGYDVKNSIFFFIHPLSQNAKS